MDSPFKPLGVLRLFGLFLFFLAVSEFFFEHVQRRTYLIDAVVAGWTAYSPDSEYFLLILVLFSSIDYSCNDYAVFDIIKNPCHLSHALSSRHAVLLSLDSVSPSLDYPENPFACLPCA